MSSLYRRNFHSPYHKILIDKRLANLIRRKRTAKLDIAREMGIGVRKISNNSLLLMIRTIHWLIIYKQIAVIRADLKGKVSSSITSSNYTLIRDSFICQIHKGNRTWQHRILWQKESFNRIIEQARKHTHSRIEKERESWRMLKGLSYSCLSHSLKISSICGIVQITVNHARYVFIHGKIP